MEAYRWIIDEIQNNQFFSAALGGSVTYAVIGYLRNFIYYIYRWFKNLFIRELTISGNDQSEIVKNFNKFCALHITHPKNIRVSNSTDRFLSYGYNWFFYNWYTFCTISINKEENNHTELNVDNMTLSILSPFARTMRTKINEEITAYINTQITTKPSIYMITSAGYARRTKFVPKRLLESIFIDEEVKNNLVDNISNMINNHKLEELGLPKTMGILLYGAPGTGKSSIITALANKFQANIFYVSLNRETKLDEVTEAISDAATSLSGKPIFIALEDLDACPIFKIRNDDDKPEFLKTTPISEALRMLDGNDLPNNTIIFATTNHPDKLDPAVKRAGRFDLKFEIRPADKEIAERMINYIDPSQIKLLDSLEFPITQAELQAKLIRVSSFTNSLPRPSVEECDNQLNDTTHHSLRKRAEMVRKYNTPFSW